IPRLMKRWNVQDGLHIDAVPSEENHCPRKLLGSLLQLSDKILLFCNLNQAFHLFLIGGRQISQPIDALIDVRQRQQIQECIEWRQDPRPEPVADEIAS